MVIMGGPPPPRAFTAPQHLRPALPHRHQHTQTEKARLHHILTAAFQKRANASALGHRMKSSVRMMPL